MPQKRTLQKRIPQSRIDDQLSISREMVREAQGILHRHLKRVGLKQTAQRDTILRTFLGKSVVARPA